MHEVASSIQEETGRDMHEWEMKNWKRTIASFGLSMRIIRRGRDTIEALLENVVSDAIKGQCQSNGHSCKTNTVELLVQLRNKVVASSAPSFGGKITRAID
jgi:hypothetical protein